MNYYTFEIDGEKVGYFECDDREGILYQNARMALDGKQYEKPFWVRHRGLEIQSYRCGDRGYTDLPVGAGVVPTSALMLFVLCSVETNGLRFPLLNEETDEIMGEASFVRSGERVQVLVNGKPGNHFLVHDNRIVEFGWGGTARSRYVPTRGAAVAGTAWDNEQGATGPPGPRRH